MPLGKNKLKVRFHNPNSEKETSKHIRKIFVQVSVARLETVLKETATPKEPNDDKK